MLYSSFPRPLFPLLFSFLHVILLIPAAAALADITFIKFFLDAAALFMIIF